MRSDVKQIDVTKFQLDSIPAGTKIRTHLVISNLHDGEQLSFPIIVTRDQHPSATLLVIGSVHVDENTKAQFNSGYLRGTGRF